MQLNLYFCFAYLANFMLLSDAGGCDQTIASEKNKETKMAPLHHIIEFGKRSNVDRKNCNNSALINSTSQTMSPGSGLHALLHSRSKEKAGPSVVQQINETSSLKGKHFQRAKNEPGMKRTNNDLKQFHKLQLKTETISMLHKIVEKYFPGGHLSVDQKIKALKLLGKLIKLKKEGKGSDMKKLLSGLSDHNHSRKIANVSQTKTNDQIHNEATEKGKQSEESKSAIQSSDDGDIYANIANGPDVPKLPPSIGGKDPDHAHSNIMPVGLQPLRGAGEMFNTITRPNDVGEDLGEFSSKRISSYQAPFSYGDLSEGHMFEHSNNFLTNSLTLSSIPHIMDRQGYARNHLPFQRHDGENWFGDRESLRYGDYDDDEDFDEDGEEEDENDDDEDDEDMEVEPGRERSYVHRHNFDEDDGEDDGYDDDDWEDGNAEEIEYTRRFDRKNKIAKIPRKFKSPSEKSVVKKPNKT